MARVGVIGDANVDLLLWTDGHPPVGGEALAERSLVCLGGSALTTAVGLARLGHEPALVTSVGADDWGERIRRDLAANGVSTRLLRTRDDTGTQLNVSIVSPGGERTMYTYGGASRLGNPEGVAALGAVDALHVSGYALLAEGQRAAVAAARALRSSGVPLSVDVPVAVVDREPERLWDLVCGADIVSVGGPELRRLVARFAGTPAGDAVADLAAPLHAAGVAAVAVKQGAGGAWLSRPGGLTRQEPQPAEVVDATGAGDAFMAGLLAGILDRRGDGETLLLADTMGALTVGHAGAGTGLASAEAIAAAVARRRPGY